MPGTVAVTGVSSASSNLEHVNSTSNALHIHSASSAVSASASWYVVTDGTAGAADNNVIYTSGDISMYDHHVIENISGAAAAVDVQVSLDGTNYNATAVAVQLLDDVTTGGGVKSLTIAQNKVGVIRGKFKGLRVLQNGAGAANARVAHGVA